MKKYSTILLATILITVILFSCKKSNSAAPKDYAASVKNKTWWGSFNYTRDTTQYYSVHFNADNTLLWVQLSGQYTGHWTVNGKTITMTFDITTAKIVADISGDNVLLNITDNTGAYEINSGALVANPNISLDNTVWKGSVINTITNATNAVQLSFKPGNLVELKPGTGVMKTYSYSRLAAGAAIYIVGGFFGVLTSGAEMKGSDSNAAFPWQAIKQ